MQESGYGARTEGRSAYGERGGYAVRKAPVRKLGNSMVTSAQSCAVLELNQGDMVSHAAFGRGMVLSVMKMGGDALLEIAFDDIGTKKLMAKTASSHMKKL